ncbi:MBL fold metallo-hydrolase [Pontiella sulfatireligans]|uniref:Hydroxyacylglutathione hydrolase n=1 Tax=Pontiella sulfatireligans TaxID=2750658 RepID=A0A6C2UTJ3_9BACT|nr:MBL fold metallo-hydrolase [Pontiella sulfatireligans]VGO22537.1 Hydroxyacylglutathione hydrolase GloB [Pontiella sulfatireligans]
MKTTRFKVGDYAVLAVPVLSDNFVYLVCRAGQAVLIDAGEAKPVFRALEKESLQLLDILITHTHHDHIGGCRAIQDRLGVQSTSPGVEAREVSMLGTVCRSFATPGHMAMHKCYYFPELGIVFTGDTLINGACGRLLGGTAEQLFNSLQLIKQLPDETMVFGGHDYLADNMAFALSVEPGNADMQARLALYRTDPASAIFATLVEEKKTNPFLRVASVEEFAALRKLKDRF